MKTIMAKNAETLLSRVWSNSNSPPDETIATIPAPKNRLKFGIRKSADDCRKD